MLKNLRIINTDHEVFIMNFSFIFLLSLWFIDLEKKIILGLFFVFLLLLNLKLKDLALSTILTYVLSTIFFIGKGYSIFLTSLKDLPYSKEAYPLGFKTIDFVITFSDILSIAILFLLIRSLFNRNFYKSFNKIDFFISLFLFWLIFVNIFFSKNPLVSFILQKEIFEAIVVYFFIKFSLKNHVIFFRYLLSMLAVIVIFEGFIAFQQFIFKSPLGKVIEVMHNFDKFGYAADEIQFIYRPVGTFIYTNDFSLLISSLLPILFLIFFTSPKKEFLLAFFTGVFILLITLGRNAWVAFFFSFAYLLYIMEYKFKINLTKKIIKFQTILLALLLLPLIIYSLPRITLSLQNLNEGGMKLRLEQIQESISLINTYPFGVGQGFSVPALIQHNKQGIFAHIPSAPLNYYLRLTLENGIPALIIFFLILFLSFKKIPARTLISHAIISCWIAIIIGGIFQNYFNYNIFFVLLALNLNKNHAL